MKQGGMKFGKAGMGKSKKGAPVGVKKGGFSANLGKCRGGLNLDGPHK